MASQLSLWVLLNLVSLLVESSDPSEVWDGSHFDLPYCRDDY